MLYGYLSLCNVMDTQVTGAPLADTQVVRAFLDIFLTMIIHNL